MLRILSIAGYGGKLLAARQELSQQSPSHVLYEAARDLGGLYLKLMQFVALRTETFDEETKLKLLSLYDKVPPVPLDVRSVITTELGEQGQAAFANIAHEPFASGSFGQVYRAQLKDGSEVIIKIKRPNLRSKLRLDFWLLSCIGFLGGLIVHSRLVDIKKTLREFKSLTYNELDYLKEVDNALFFEERYKAHPTVVIPHTYAELSTNNLIVQEYVDGVAVTELLKRRLEGRDIQQLMQSGFNTDMRQILVELSYEVGYQVLAYPYFYADPHPGNLLILRDNRFAIIDFGILGRSPRNKANYYRIMKILVQQPHDYNAAELGEEILAFGASYFYQCLDTLDYYANENADASLKQAVSAHYEKLLERGKEKFKQIQLDERENFTEIVFQILKLGEKFNVMVPPELFALVRASAMIKFLTAYVDPTVRPMRTVYARLLDDIDPKRLVNEDYLPENRVSLEEALESMMEWVSGIAERDEPFFFRLKSTMEQLSYV